MRKILLLLLLFVPYAARTYAVLQPTTLYVYGFAMCLNDSVVYFTDVMTLDSAWIDSHSGFLYERQSYSYQLKNFLVKGGVVDPTCVISFEEKQKKAEKQYVKLRERYTKKLKGFTVKYVPITDFTFSAISAAGEPNAVGNITKEEEKAEKKKRKAAKAAAREQERPDMRGGGRGPGGGAGGGHPSGPPPGGGMGGGM